MIPHRTQLEIHLYAFYTWAVLNMWISILENEDVPKLPHVCLPEWFCPISTNIWTLAFQIWILICSICSNSLMKSPFLIRNFDTNSPTSYINQAINQNHPKKPYKTPRWTQWFLFFSIWRWLQKPSQWHSVARMPWPAEFKPRSH